MSSSISLSTVLSTLKFILGLRKKPIAEPQKIIHAKIIDRCIIAELPHGLGIHITDDEGNKYDGIYVIGMMIWNKGTLPVLASDFSEKAPLQIRVGQDATIIDAKIIPTNEDFAYSYKKIDDRSVTIEFDFLNPNDYLVVPVFISGQPMTNVQVHGRFIGQKDAIDQTAAEATASWHERLASLWILLFLINAIPGFFIGGWFILQDYGIDLFIHNADRIPHYLTIPFIMGTAAISMYAISRISYYLERKKHPEGYPLMSDFEPPLLENIMGLIRTIFQAKKQRLSTSIFSWGKPVTLVNKKTNRRSVNDWIR